MADQDATRHFLFPGTLHVSKEECLITTVLGSCVAVCLWDQVYGGGGMNHFMLPSWGGDGPATPKYGTVAMEKLLERVLKLGCTHSYLVAKVFGGANVNETSSNSFQIGERNAALALQMLQEWRIPVVSTDLGGRLGRKIVMNTLTGEVLVSKGQRAT